MDNKNSRCNKYFIGAYQEFIGTITNFVDILTKSTLAVKNCSQDLKKAVVKKVARERGWPRSMQK